MKLTREDKTRPCPKCSRGQQYDYINKRWIPCPVCKGTRRINAK